MLPRHLITNMLSLSICVILCFDVSLSAETKFPYDINPGPVSPPDESHNFTREKRAVCELTKGGFDRSQKIQLRWSHNNFRRNMAITGTYMKRLDWKIELAQRAQAWADQCIYEHDYLYDCNGKRMGQNLYVSWGNTVYPTLDASEVVKAWHDEIQYYDLDTNSCSGVCGHYKQVVWANSQYFGCGVAYCPTLEHPGAAQKKMAVYVACNYSPAGNYGGNRPYTAGTPCESCPSGFKCQRNLCVPA